MSSESGECPLCMEPMDFDDVDFFPCPCRYQICRFCWYKIINEENGLCPACRKPYNSEHPASYKPRTEEEIKIKLKSSKKVCPKKGKPAQEGKEYLSEYRVLQKNLIFVVGLPMRMAEEVELLKGLDYFGKCGKVYKIVINQNQTFPGPQGTSCLSAYVTYHRNEDALKTLVDLKKLEIDGRAVKLSLGTTKYCSQFLRNRKCTKQDCMYLHEMGDQAASFTKEDMANGKHTEYENQLIQEYHDSSKLNIVNVCTTSSTATTTSITSSDCVTPTQRKTSLTSSISTTSTPHILPTNSKSQRPGLVHMTPIGTDPNDASKVYMVSGDISNSKLPPVSKTGPDQTLSNVSKDNYQHSIMDNSQSNTSHPSENLGSSLNSSSPLSRVSDTFMNCMNSDNSNSLLESFYQLNSQSNSATNQQYDHNINQQANNNGVLNYSQYLHRTDMDFNRFFGSDKNNSNYEQKFKDTADIDFDPINVSRQALAEMIANENRQKSTPGMNNYLTNKLIPNDPLYAPLPQRGMLRPNPHDYIMQSNNDFFNLNSRAPGQPFIHDKPSPNESRLNQQMTNLNLVANPNNIIPSTSTAVQSISSGFPSPPPGFESTSNNSCLGDPSSSDIMTLLMNNPNNVDMYPRYQNQHSSPDLQMGINHNQFNNQFPINYNCPNQISTGSNYHNDFNYSNGGMMFNDINSQSLHGSHSWKNAQSAFCDGPSDISHTAIRSSGYNRSHSMNENSGIRNSEWNGFSSYTSPNESHLSNFQEGNFNMMSSMRVQSVQCTPSNVSGNDPQLFSRQQTSHSVNH